MKITIFAAGSRGDVQPCIVLGKGLLQAGYQVTLAAPEDFADFAQQHHVDFYPLRGDVQKVMASDTGRQYMESGGSNPFKSIRAMRTLLAPIVKLMVEDAYDACKNSDGIICQGVLAAFGKTIAEVLNIPIINLEPTPLLPSRAFPAPSWPIQKDLGGWHNYLSGVVMLRVVWMWYQPFVNDFRKNLGLPPISGSDFQHILSSTPMLSAYSPSIIPHPADWQDNIHISGYLFLDHQPNWQPSSQLQRFLESGSPPVYIGSGSMAGSNPQQLANIIIDALARSGQRGLIVTGWGGLRPEAVPENIHVVDSAPHGWLFPHMAAVVHHGGAGTTAEGLRAGVPTVVVPFAFDQSFWGARVHAMGFGPAPIAKKNLTSERLSKSINQALNDTHIIHNTKECGKAIRIENGVENAIKIIERYLGKP